MKSVLLVTCAVLFAFVPPALAQQTIFLVRHAERADAAAPAGGAMTAPATDPPLSVAGQERAARLAAMLRSANIRALFTTEFLRTRQTAAPLAQAVHLEITAISAKEADALVKQVRDVKGNVLIVGHSNTVPDLLKRFGVKEDITVADNEFDNLFILVRPDAGEPALIRLRY